MDTITRLLHLAANKAQRSKTKIDKRTFFLASIGLRKDGAMVLSRNGSDYERNALIHSEVRLSKKLDFGAIVFVSRINKLGEWALARPCYNCERTLKNKGVRKVYYTIAPNEYGVMCM